MRLKIRHETRFTYATPAHSAIQLLRLTPRNHDGQFVKRWRVEADADYRLDRDEDAFGNITHLFSIEGPIESMSIAVEGEVETTDTAGIVRGTAERAPLGLWLRDSALTIADPPVRDFARATSAREGGQTLPSLHAINEEIHDLMTLISDEDGLTQKPEDVFKTLKGTSRDLAQYFIACARVLHIPARYVSGYYLTGEDGDAGGSHAWAEAHVDGIGWIGFDPAIGRSPTDHYIRVAVGIDSLDAAPVRSAHLGGFDEELKASVRVQSGQTLVEE